MDGLLELWMVFRKLRAKNNAGQLRQLGCSYEPFGRNVTRWTSAFAMIKRYREIKAFINGTNFPDLIHLLLTPTQEATVEGMFTTFEKLYSITIALQKDDLTLSQARILFDAAIAIIPGGSIYLTEDADILNDPIYISGIVKVQNNECHLLELLEEAKLTCFEVKDKDSSTIEIGDDDDDYALTILTQAKKNKSTECIRKFGLDTIYP